MCFQMGIMISCMDYAFAFPFEHLKDSYKSVCFSCVYKVEGFSNNKISTEVALPCF